MKITIINQFSFLIKPSYYIIFLENKPTSKEDYMPLAMPAWDSTSLGVNRRELKALFNARMSILSN